jgi:putative copper export protein/mono/diheme cytochrome c family protein
MGDPLTWIRAVHFAATLTLAGALVFGAVVAAPAWRGADDDAGRATFRLRLLRIAWTGLALAVISGAAWQVLLAAGMSDGPPAEVFSGGILATVLLHTTFGHAWLVRFALAALLAAALSWISSKRADRSPWAIAALLALVFTAALVHSGHAAATAGWLGSFHRAADGLHLLAASAWLGGLLPLAVLLAAAGRDEIAPAVARAVTLRFSVLGVISVAILLATGTVNGWLLAGSMPALIGTDYGRLLVIKVALFLVMVAIAAVNRLRLTPRLVRAGKEDDEVTAGRKALRALARNSAIETALGLAILVLVGALGTTPPGAHVQPLWPLALRYSDAAFGDPELRAKLVPALWAIGGGVLLGTGLIVGGVVARRLAWLPLPRPRAWLIAAGSGIAIACVAYFAPVLRLATVEAYPTSFHVSPTGYSANSIMQGVSLFATHCASCHGRQGRGDGPAGRFFRVKPSDLTADHVYAHSDGDLYWWITHGIREVMPPFGAVLDEEARWNVVDFVRANADAARLRQVPGKVTDTGYRMPDFSAACPDGSTLWRDDLRGRIAHLVIAGRGSAARLAQLTAHDRDVVTIAIPIDDVATAAACRTDEAALAKAFATLHAGTPAQSGGIEALVDASGTLRALWSPGGKPDWRDDEVLQREIAAIRNSPVASRTTGSHLHGH